MMEAIVLIRAHVFPLDDPSPSWCEEHMLSCRVVQHFVISVQIGSGPLVPHEVVRGESHD